MRIANVVATAAVVMGIGKMGVTAPARFEKTGQVVGQLVDVNDHITYAGEAVVFLCDARTSYPIHRKTKRPVKINVMDRLSEIWETWYVVTDENGVFQFNEVPVGCYRLVAQSWSGTKGMPKGKPSTFVMLHGVAENVEVKEGKRTRAYPRQLGNRVLRITNDPEEPHAFLLISLKPALGDAILGPYGWGNEFVSQVVGVTGMEQSHVTIFGLPDDRDVHVALFNYDNSPGFGTGSYKADQREGKLRIVASWSNGHHDPPPELKKLTDYLEDNKVRFNDFLNGKEKVKRDLDARQELLKCLSDDPEREVEVRGLGKRRLVDVVAALSYIRLRAAFRK